MIAITRTLSEFVANIDYGTLPPEVPERAKLLLMDIVGNALRARHDADSTPAMLAAVRKLGLGSGDASVIGDSSRFAPPGAALVNGALAHSLDFDDTHAPGSIHPSAPIVPAALAAAEMCGAGGRDLIAGIVAGYEVQIRLSLALVPKDHYDQGFHPTATCGTFGAAAAAARIFGLSAEQTASAFGLCGSQAAGSMQFLADGAWNKRFHVGYAAMNGLIAASFARDAYKGAADAIEGNAGFLRAYSPSPMLEMATDGLGERYETMAIAVKPYPSCRYSHAAIDALSALRAANDIGWQDIQSVEIGLPKTGMYIIGEPQNDKQNPKNVVDGQFSMPFCAAVALREGRMDWDHYAEHLNDAQTLELCRRISCVADPRVEAEFPTNMSGIARITTSQGHFEEFVVVPKGEPDNFVTSAELRAKFDALVSPYLDAGARDGLARTLLTVETQTDVRALLGMTQAVPAPALKAAATGDD